jgi:hypothetical protein
MKNAAFLALIASLLVAGTAGAELCQFGYADAAIVGDALTLGWSAARNAGVPQDSGRIIPLDGTQVAAHTRNIKQYIQTMNAVGIRPFVDLSEVIFNANPVVNPTCGNEYERGDSRKTWPLIHQEFKGSYEAKLDSFLALNASELGTDSIRGFIIHVEVNNNCVPTWRVDAAARALKARGYGPAQGYALAAGYGLDNTNLPGFSYVGTGMPTGKFPLELTHIMPWSYDIHSLFVNSVYNLNNDVKQLGVAGFWNKLVGKLRPGQQVIWGMLALCEQLQGLMFNGPHLAPQDRLGTQCTNLPLVGTWPLASVADHWRWFAEQQPRMEGLIAINWTGTHGTGALDPAVANAHVLNGNSASTCE